MSFFGRAFEFDSTPCEKFELMMYDIGNQDTDISIAGVHSIEDESIGDKWKPYFYGTKPGEKLEFDITFGVNQRRIDAGKFLDRWEVEEISAWLTGHTGYKWLYIDQPDMDPFGYRCMITKLDTTQYGAIPWAFKAHVTCDSPYAYLSTRTTTATLNGSETTIQLINESSLNGFYKPNISFERTGGSAFSIKNAQDNDMGPEFTDIPGSVSTIEIDNEHCVITNDQGLNLYDAGFNFQFLRLARGLNTLTATGTGVLTITCEFPVNVGG